MDYLNPKNRKNHLIRLFIGYGLVAIAISLAVVILYFLVLGFSYHNGTIVQNGMMYIDSTPQGAQLTVNNTLEGQTNKRLIMPSGSYQVSIDKDGYRSWHRKINLVGGKVQRYTYPLLIPNQLVSSSTLSLDGKSPLVTQSPNQRWLLVANTVNLAKFKLVDLKHSQSPAITNYSLPRNLLSPTAGVVAGSWKLVEWSDDSIHVLLEHTYGGKREFILIDLTDPAKSVNLNAAFGEALSHVELFNGNYDEYWVFNPLTHELDRASLGGKTVTPYLKGVLAYEAYQDNGVLYVSSDGAVPGKAHVLWFQDGKNYPINLDIKRSNRSSDYLLGATSYEGTLYIVAGESSEPKINIYKDPLKQFAVHPDTIAPFERLPIKAPNYLKISPDNRYILAENGRSIAVYNIAYNEIYSYSLSRLDKPQQHVNWIDGYHLTYVAGGQLNIVDFNNLNKQALVAASSQYEAFFDPSDEYLFTVNDTLAKDGTYTTTLNQTALRTKADI